MFNFPLLIISTHACFIYGFFFSEACNQIWISRVARHERHKFWFFNFLVKIDNELKEMAVLIVNDLLFLNQNKKCRPQTFICTCKPNYGTYWLHYIDFWKGGDWHTCYSHSSISVVFLITLTMMYCHNNKLDVQISTTKQHVYFVGNIM